MLIHCNAVIYTVNKFHENITTYVALNDITTFDDVLAEARCETNEKY
jgi:hypothetical protein